MKKLEDSLPLQLLRSRESTMKFFSPVLKKAGFTEQQWRVLRVLNDHGELETNRLAKLCCILSPSLSRIVMRFENDGLLHRKQANKDQRIYLLSLTPKGRKTVNRYILEVDMAYNELINKLGDKKLKALSSLLDEVIALDKKVK